MKRRAPHTRLTQRIRLWWHEFRCGPVVARGWNVYAGVVPHPSRFSHQYWTYRCDNCGHQWPLNITNNQGEPA